MLLDRISVRFSWIPLTWFAIVVLCFRSHLLEYVWLMVRVRSMLSESVMWVYCRDLVKYDRCLSSYHAAN